MSLHTCSSGFFPSQISKLCPILLDNPLFSLYIEADYHLGEQPGQNEHPVGRISIYESDLFQYFAKVGFQQFYIALE